MQCLCAARQVIIKHMKEYKNNVEIYSWCLQPISKLVKEIRGEAKNEKCHEYEELKCKRTF